MLAFGRLDGTSVSHAQLAQREEIEAH